MSRQSQPLSESFSTYPSETKLGYDKLQIALELQQNLDLVIALNRNSKEASIDNELQFATVVKDSYRLIHEYATSANISGVMSRATPQSDSIQKDETKSGSVNELGDERIRLVSLIQSWILDGLNPFNELGLVDAHELIAHSENRELAKLEKIDIERFQDAMELSAQGYANSSLIGYEELDESTILNGNTPGFFNAVYDSSNGQLEKKDQLLKRLSAEKIRKLGHAISGFFNVSK